MGITKGIKKFEVSFKDFGNPSVDVRLIFSIKAENISQLKSEIDQIFDKYQSTEL